MNTPQKKDRAQNVRTFILLALCLALLGLIAKRAQAMGRLSLGAAATLALVSTSARADVVFVEPDLEPVSPATVEKVIVLRKESSQAPGIRFVQVDNGGSTDVSSLMVPSRLYLTLHQDGEMFDIEGSYLVVDGLVSVKEAKLKGERIELTYLRKDDELKPRTIRMTLTLTAALKEAKSASGGEEGGAYVLKSTVTSASDEQ